MDTGIIIAELGARLHVPPEHRRASGEVSNGLKLLEVSFIFVWKYGSGVLNGKIKIICRKSSNAVCYCSRNKYCIVIRIVLIKEFFSINHLQKH